VTAIERARSKCFLSTTNRLPRLEARNASN
jgi:hypothetical protein